MVGIHGYGGIWLHGLRRFGTLCADVYDVGMAWVQASSLKFDIDEEVVEVLLI